MQRHRIQRAVIAEIGRRGRRRVRVAAVEPVRDVGDDLAADPDRGVGAWDQEGARETAAEARLPGGRRWWAARIEPAHRRDGRLRQLVEATLQELLIGAQIRQLVGLGRRQARQQRDRSGQPAQRRDRADSPLSAHCSPKHQKLRSAARRTRVPLA